MISSVLYVIGQMKDSHFKKELESLKIHRWVRRLKSRRAFLGPFMRLSDRKGFELMDELFSLPYQEGQPLPSLHFLSQLEPRGPLRSDSIFGKEASKRARDTGQCGEPSPEFHFRFS